MENPETLAPDAPRAEDPRAMRSRQAMRDALLDLIEVRPFHEISIKDITKKACLSYPVFFRHYDRKEGIIAEIASIEVEGLFLTSLPLFDEHAEVESLRALCTYVHDRRILWTRLLTGGASDIMRSEFIRIARKVGSRKDPWLPIDLAARYVASGLLRYSRGG